MHRRKTPKISYQKMDVDSGYLSDLVETARRSDEAAAKLLLSSSPGPGSELVMNTFNDTEWDIVATGAQLGILNRRCNNLAKQVKKPTRFPIIPLECTLARARAKSEMRRRRSTPGSDEVAGQWHTSESAVVDGRGRTRAAAKKAAAAKNGAGLVSAGLKEIQQKTDTKRKRGQAQNAGQQKASRRRQTR